MIYPEPVLPKDIDPEKARDFWKFHSEYPEVWQRVCAMAFGLIARGRSHYGMKAIFEVIRYETSLGDKHGLWKIDNNRTATFARAWGATFPNRVSFFRTRDQHQEAA